MGDDFYRSKNTTNNIKVLNEKAVNENKPKNRKKTQITHMHTQWLNSAGTGRNGVPPPVSGVPSAEIAVLPPKVVVRPPGNDVPSPFGENH